MKYLFINVVCGIKSTGRICTDLAQDLEKEGHMVKIAYGRDDVPQQYKNYAVKIGNTYSPKINATVARVFDNDGFFAYQETKTFLKWAEKYDPDVLWLHNLHGYYINVKLLFDWIKSRPDMKVKWTLHDCWAFTGHCAYFSYVGCEKWKTLCGNCEQKKCYPKSLCRDNSKNNYLNKRDCFVGVNNLVIITPSNWLAHLVKQSYLKDYPLEVIYNSIDKTVFKPTISSFRSDYNLNNKKVILGVASSWDKRKGLDVFIDLADRLDDTFAIVLVGLTEVQIKNLPDNIIGLKKTNSTLELAQLYSMADVFLNPSVEETFGMTTIEALSCGTKAIVLKGTACEEVALNYGGQVVDPGIENIFDKLCQLI